MSLAPAVKSQEIRGSQQLIPQSLVIPRIWKYCRSHWQTPRQLHLLRYATYDVHKDALPFVSYTVIAKKVGLTATTVRLKILAYRQGKTTSTI